MCFRHYSAVVALLLCLCCPQWMGCRVNIYQIVSEDSCLKCAPRWDTYPWPLGKGGWTQNVCAYTGAWASIIVRAWLSRSLSSNSKGFPVQLPGRFFLVVWGFLFFACSFAWVLVWFCPSGGLKAICFSVMFSHCTCGLAQRGGHPSMVLLTKGWSSPDWRKHPSNRPVMYFCVVETKWKKKQLILWELGSSVLCPLFSVWELFVSVFIQEIYSVVPWMHCTLA